MSADDGLYSEDAQQPLNDVSLNHLDNNSTTNPPQIVRRQVVNTTTLVLPFLCMTASSSIKSWIEADFLQVSL